MPELRSGARQPRSPPPVPVVAEPLACAETLPARLKTSRRRVGGAGGGTSGAVAGGPTLPVGNRVRTRAAVAKEAAVVTPKVAGRGKGAGGGTGRVAKQTRNTKATVQPKVTSVPKVKLAGWVKQVPSRSHSPAQEPLHDLCRLVDKVEEGLDPGEENQEEGPEEIREMEEESAGRSADKVPGAGDDDGSAAPLPERVKPCTLFFFCICICTLRKG